MKSVKRKFKIFSNFFWLLILAPLFVKAVKYEIPKMLMLLVSWFVWSCLSFLILGVVLSKIGGSSPKWIEDVAHNPYIVINKTFAIALISLDLFYFYATFKDLWNIEDIKKFLYDVD